MRVWSIRLKTDTRPMKVKVAPYGCESRCVLARLPKIGGWSQAGQYAAGFLSFEEWSQARGSCNPNEADRA